MTTYAYDLDRKLTDMIRPDGGHVHVGYDGAGRPTNVTLPSGNMAFGYDASTGRLVSATGPSAGQALSYSYDGPLLTQTTWSGIVSGSVQRTYDNFFRVASESVNGGFVIDYGYDSDGLLTKAGALTLARHAANGLLTGTTLGGVTDSYAYDGYGQVASYTAKHGSAVLYSYSVTRDALGRIARKVETVDGLMRLYEYGYNDRGWLTDVAIDGQFAEGYEYDANGNRTALVKPGSRVSAYYDAQDRLLAYGDATYTYTANGELRTKTDAGGVTTYTYDAMGNLLRVELPDGKRIDYVVDSAGRRIAKKVNGTLTRQWLYRDGLKPIAELDGNGAIIALFGYGERYTTPSFVERDGKRYRFISDHLGSPRMVVRDSDSSERPVVAEYSAFGEVTGSGLDWMPFGFAGGIYDPDTGLVRFGARDYDPVVGRWTAKDPVRFAGGLGSLFGYAGNDPVNYQDVYGTRIDAADPEAQAALGRLWDNPYLRPFLDDLAMSDEFDIYVWPVEDPQCTTGAQWWCYPDSGRRECEVKYTVECLPDIFRKHGCEGGLDQALAHELGHAWAEKFGHSEYSDQLAIDFENATRRRGPWRERHNRH